MAAVYGVLPSFCMLPAFLLYAPPIPFVSVCFLLLPGIQSFQRLAPDPARFFSPAPRDASRSQTQTVMAHGQSAGASHSVIRKHDDVHFRFCQDNSSDGKADHQPFAKPVPQSSLRLTDRHWVRFYRHRERSEAAIPVGCPAFSGLLRRFASRNDGSEGLERQ